MPHFPQAAWMQMAPYPPAQKRIGALETVSVILGILGICLHWVVLFRWGLFLSIAPLILSILAIIFGYISVRRMLGKDFVRESEEGNVGLAGLCLGILTLMFTVAWLFLAQTFLWGWGI